MKYTLILICSIINLSGCVYNIYAPHDNVVLENITVRQQDLTVRNKDYPKVQK
jgi:hypothetical protein